jgi:hypothetical protein
VGKDTFKAQLPIHITVHYLKYELNKKVQSKQIGPLTESAVNFGCMLFSVQGTFEIQYLDLRNSFIYIILRNEKLSPGRRRGPVDTAPLFLNLGISRDGWSDSQTGYFTLGGEKILSIH